MKCLICNYPCKKDLCKIHKKLYKWDYKANGYRLKKRLLGSRYTQERYHKNEIKLTKIIENIYGKKNVVTSYRPLWAVSDKGVLLEFDIFIINKKILIEYQGEEHYNLDNNFFNKSKKQYLARVKRDKLKANLAKTNGYKLVIFKYNEPKFRDYIIQKINGNTSIYKNSRPA